MKSKFIILAMGLLFTSSINAQPQLVKKNLKSLTVCPKVFTTLGESYIQNIDSNYIATILNKDFTPIKSFYCGCKTKSSGSISQSAVVTPTGAKLSYSFSSSPVYDTDGQVMTATSAMNMVTKLKAKNNYDYTTFTDLNGNIACYQNYTDSYEQTFYFYCYNIFGTSYPINYYFIKDGKVYSTSYVNYAPIYDESKVKWEFSGSSSSGSERIGQPSPMTFYDYDDDIYNDRSFYFSQTLFNDDDKWEYQCKEYGDSVLVPSSYVNSSTNSNGTISLSRSVTVIYPIKNILIKNEDGTILYRLPIDSRFISQYGCDATIEYIIKMNGKYYAFIYCYYNNIYDIYVLDKQSKTFSKADINGDGTVDVNDVNAVVNTICGK